MDKSNESLSSVLCNSKFKSESGCSNKGNFADAKVGLQEMKSKFPDKLIMGHLNINSIRNKLDALPLIVKNNVHILMISETKLDDSFLTAQFLLNSFSEPYRLDRNSKAGGILSYIRKYIPSRLLNSKSKIGIETISVEINLRKRKWFLNRSYSSNKNLISNHFECLNHIMDEFSKNYDNVIFLGDFNTCINNNAIKSFCYTFNQHVIKILKN